MTAPIDIVIDIIKRHLEEVKEQQKVIEDIVHPAYKAGKRVAYEDLIAEFEGFKKLFS